MKADKRFEIIGKESHGMVQEAVVLRDKETGVQYLFYKSGYGGGLAALLDKEGKPLISEPKDGYWN